MSTYRTRHNKTNPYVMLNKGFLEDPNLSAKAKGILAYLLSRPDDWQTHTDHLIKVMRDGRDSILSGLKELAQAGYFIRYPVRDEKTQQITHWVKDVFESPQLDDGKAIKGKAVNGKAVEGNPSDGMPDDGSPSDGKPCEEMAVSLISNEALSTDGLNTDLLTTDSLTPTTRPKKEVCVEKEELARNRNGGRPPAPNINSLVSQEVIERIEQSTVICEDNFSGAAVITKERQVSQSTKWREERRREIHPHLVYCEGETPWLNSDSQFKAEFVRWTAQRWMEKFPGKRTIYEAEEDVLSNFFNEPDKIPLRWRTYSLNFNHHFERAVQRIASGGTVGDEEKQYLKTNLEAVRSPMPEAAVSKSETTLGRDVTATPSLPPTPTPALPEGFKSDSNTYREYKPTVQVSEEEARANILRLKEMMRNRGSTKALPAPEPPKPETVLQQLVADLDDPVMQRDATVQALAQKFVGENEEYAADYNDRGMIVAIYQF